VSVGKLFVGNLPWKLTEESLIEHFSSIGNVVSAKIIKDKNTGTSRGFGFVEMDNFNLAIEDLNGKELEGRALVVNEARPKTTTYA
jgi:RNA recognition motif-containing protein